MGSLSYSVKPFYSAIKIAVTRLRNRPAPVEIQSPKGDFAKVAATSSR